MLRLGMKTKIIDVNKRFVISKSIRHSYIRATAIFQKSLNFFSSFRCILSIDLISLSEILLESLTHQAFGFAETLERNF